MSIDPMPSEEDYGHYVYTEGSKEMRDSMDGLASKDGPIQEDDDEICNKRVVKRAK